MEQSLQQESEKLARSWLRHDPTMLRDYLVAGVEDPRINLQSILSRHFIVRALTGSRFSALMRQECRFGAAMNWLVKLAPQLGGAEEAAIILYALRRGADNAEGVEIPQFVVQLFAALPTAAGGSDVPNYIESFLSGAQFVNGAARLHEPSLDTYCRLWSRALVAEAPALRDSRQGEPEDPPAQRSPSSPERLRVLEPACGSANDYRFLHACGIARLIDYAGFDLCPTNIENARALYPGIWFEVGNAFQIAAPDKSFDLCFIHDLFEHLSLAGIQAAVREVCRVTRGGICVGFFNLDEIREHVVRPVDEYHWNTLSMARMRELFAGHGFDAQVIHIGKFLHREVSCEETHNPNAYTFLLWPSTAPRDGLAVSLPG